MSIVHTPYTEDSIADLLARGEVEGSRLRTQTVLDEMEALPPRTLLPGTEHFADDWIVEFHKTRQVGRPFSVPCHFVNGLTVSGRGHVFLDGRLLMAPELLPAYWKHAILEHGVPDIDRERSLPVRTIEGPCIVFMGWGESTYGHFLLEALPRLLIARKALGERFANAAMLIPTNAGAWLLPMIESALGYGMPKVEWYDPDIEQIHIAEAVLTTLPAADGCLHPALCPLLDEARHRLIGRLPGERLVEKLFVTRAYFDNLLSERRRCRNELSIATIAAREFGYTVLPIETLPWRSQIKMLFDADVIVGEFGSGLHGSIFSRPGRIVGCIGLLNLSQSVVGAFRQHRNAYLKTGPRDDSGHYEVDEDAFRRFLEAIANQARL